MKYRYNMNGLAKKPENTYHRLNDQIREATRVFISGHDRKLLHLPHLSGKITQLVLQASSWG